MSTLIERLNEKFGIEAAACFQIGAGDLSRLELRTETAQAHVYLHGAHVTHFQVEGQHPLLWVSQDSRFENGKAIRGGVPICFPWFAQKEDDLTAAMHGLVRTQRWNVESVRQLNDGSVCAVLDIDLPALDEPEAEQFHVIYRVKIDASVNPALTMTLQIHNVGHDSNFEQALHTYLEVGDVRRVLLRGLQGASYIDKTDQLARKVCGPEPMTFEAETDCVFINTPGVCEIADPVLGRTIRIGKSGSNSTVVWNPWTDKARRMDDFADDQWPSMLCIETANVADNRVALESGAMHQMTATISSDSSGPSS